VSLSLVVGEKKGEIEKKGGRSRGFYDLCWEGERRKNKAVGSEEKS
jgi:hypothetical protein